MNMIGVDVVCIPKFAAVIEGKRGASVLRSIFSDSEIAECDNADRRIVLRSLAGRFAAKEAVIKASRSRLSIDDMTTIHVIQEFSGCIRAVAEKDGTRSELYDVSISHDGDYAVSVALAVGGSVLREDARA